MTRGDVLCAGPARLLTTRVACGRACRAAGLTGCGLRPAPQVIADDTLKGFGSRMRLSAAVSSSQDGSGAAPAAAAAAGVRRSVQRPPGSRRAGPGGEEGSAGGATPTRGVWGWGRSCGCVRTGCVAVAACVPCCGVGLTEALLSWQAASGRVPRQPRPRARAASRPGWHRRWVGWLRIRQPHTGTAEQARSAAH
jgi:hypothetical protein